MTDMFTQFDRLGAVLGKLTCHAASAGLIRREDGTVFYTFNLHPIPGFCVQGTADTLSGALEKALAENARRERMLVEIASEQVAA